MRQGLSLYTVITYFRTPSANRLGLGLALGSHAAEVCRTLCHGSLGELMAILRAYDSSAEERGWSARRCHRPMPGRLRVFGWIWRCLWDGCECDDRFDRQLLHVEQPPVWQRTRCRDWKGGEGAFAAFPARIWRGDGCWKGGYEDVETGLRGMERACHHHQWPTGLR